jgi:hypothetical protein
VHHLIGAFQHIRQVAQGLDHLGLVVERNIHPSGASTIFAPVAGCLASRPAQRSTLTIYYFSGLDLPKYASVVT